MFRGASHINLDAKGRMAVPARHRDRLLEICGGRLIVTLDREGCLLFYPFPEWERIESELMKLPSLNKLVRELQRQMLGNATECELDGQGRILLPSSLREAVGINKHVVLAGQGNKFELWDEERWLGKREAFLNGTDNSEELSVALDSLSI